MIGRLGFCRAVSRQREIPSWGCRRRWRWIKSTSGWKNVGFCRPQPGRACLPGAEQESTHPPPPADVCLVLEGTYPYVQGGVSAWAHDLIRGLPHLRFAIVHIGPEKGAYQRRHYELPENVVTLTDL